MDQEGSSPAHRRMLLVLFVGVLVGALDIAIVGPALPSIGRSLDAGPRALSWVFTVYVLFNLVGTPLVARLSDLYGRRSLYVLSVVLFGSGSLLVATAGSFSVLLLGRAVQGLGAGGIFPIATAVIGDVFPPQVRGRALGLLGAVFGLAFLVGPVLGGLLLPYGWQWLFLINLPVAAVVVVTAMRILPSGRPAAGGALDLPGVLLLGTGLVALALGFNSLDAERLFASLSDPRIWPLLLAAVVLLILFWRVEVTARDPLIDTAVLRNRQLRIANLLSFAAGAIEAGLVFVPSLIVRAFGVEPAQASFLLLPAVLAMAVGAPVTGRLLDRHGSRAVVIAGSLVLAAGLLLVRWTTGSLPAFLSAGLVMGLGLSSLVGAPLRYIVLNEASEQHRASAQAVVTLLRSIGRMVAGALLGALIASQAEGLGGYHLSFDVLAVAVLAGALLALGLKNREDERATARRAGS